MILPRFYIGYQPKRRREKNPVNCLQKPVPFSMAINFGWRLMFQRLHRQIEASRTRLESGLAVFVFNQSRTDVLFAFDGVESVGGAEVRTGQDAGGAETGRRQHAQHATETVVQRNRQRYTMHLEQYVFEKKNKTDFNRATLCSNGKR